MGFTNSWFNSRLQRGQQRLEALEIHCTSPILDLGSGDGVSTVLLAKLYPSSRIVALDRQCPVLTQVQTRLSSTPTHFTGLLCTDMQRLPFQDHTFSTILLSFALHDTPDLEPLIKEVARITRARGILGIIEYHGSLRAPWISFPVEQNKLVNLLKKNGFTQIHIKFTEERVYGIQATKA